LRTAWAGRDGQSLTTTVLGPRAKPHIASWQAALNSAPSLQADLDQLLIELELSADLPSPPDLHAARREFQLKLLTQKHREAAKPWAQVVTAVLSRPFNEAAALRLEDVLRAVLAPTGKP
jgi:ATP-dependent RNA helicase SUPV3L1/SUV3